MAGFSGAPQGFVFSTAAFDPQTFYNGVLADSTAFNKNVHLIWLGVGTAEAERMHTGVLSFHQALDQSGIRHVFYESRGTAHEWQTWRRDLADLLPRLFTGEAK
jgi:enterochelin esterase family protein